ncbi:MAG: hypothetical protein Q9222_003843 [Ikaeria aurantiellina]
MRARSSHSKSRQGSISSQGASRDTHSRNYKLSVESKDRQPSKYPPKSSESYQLKSDSTEAPDEEHHHIQSRLLRLHVLHSASAEVHTQWRESAKRYFQQRFEELADRHTEIADVVYQSQELKNQAALVDWCYNAQGSDIRKRLHSLSKSINGVCEILDPCGKYDQVIGFFEAWFNQAQEVRESRKSTLSTAVTKAATIEEIGMGWQDDVSALQWTLSTLTGELRTLGSASMSSHLGQLLRLLQDSVMDCLAELDCIRSIECEIVAHENEWHEDQNVRSSPKRVGGRVENRKTPKKLHH